MCYHFLPAGHLAKRTILIAACALSACASTEIRPIGEQRLHAISHGSLFDDEITLRNTAMSAGATHCTTINRHFYFENMAVFPDKFGKRVAMVTFSCLNSRHV